MQVFRCFWILFIAGLFYQRYGLATDINNTAGEMVDGQYLLNIGKQMNKPTLTLIGKAIKNLHPCGEWAVWTKCTAGGQNHFGIRRRTRSCIVNKRTNGSATIKTEKDFSICEGWCPDNYEFTEHGFCIKVYTISKNQDEGDKTCQIDGGNLINIETEVKYGDLKNISGLPTTYMHIGGRCKDNNSPWVFAYGAQTGFFKWGSGEPDNASTELCLVMKGSDKLMYDAACSHQRPFICELYE